MRFVIAALLIGLASPAMTQETPREQPVEPSPAQEQPAEQPAIEVEPIAPTTAPAEPGRAEQDGPTTKDRAEVSHNDDQIWWYGDTPAQWLMAATGVTAFFLSAWAVWLLRATLHATRKAVEAADNTVEVTRLLGEAQVRAYLYCVSASFERTKEYVAAIIELGNAGNSPASNVKVEGDVGLQEVIGLSHMPRVVAWANSRKDEAHFQPVLANGSVSDRIYFFWDTDFLTQIEDSDVEITRTVFNDGNAIWFDLVVSWDDVFGKTHEFPLSLDGIIGPHPVKPSKKRSRAGPLDIRMEDARARLAAEAEPSDD